MLTEYNMNILGLAQHINNGKLASYEMFGAHLIILLSGWSGFCWPS